MAKSRKKKPTPVASSTPKRSFSKPAPAADVPEAITDQSIVMENEEPAPAADVPEAITDQSIVMENEEPAAVEPKKEINLNGVQDVIGAINDMAQSAPAVKGDQPVSESKANDIYKDVKPSNLFPPFMANRKK